MTMTMTPSFTSTHSKASGAMTSSPLHGAGDSPQKGLDEKPDEARAQRQRELERMLMDADGEEADGEGARRRRLATEATTANLKSGYDDTPAGGKLVLTEGTYRGSERLKIEKAMTIECTGGDLCVVDGQDDHRCLYIDGVNGAGEEVIVKDMTVTNGNAGSGGTVSAESN